MKNLVVFSLFAFSFAAHSNKGPMPHERIDTPNLKNANSGRYLYLGDVPKFQAEELEITISKMSLTTRATGHVSQKLIDGYATQMFLRWKTMNDAFMDPSFSLHPLVKLSQLAQGQPVNTQAWIKIAEQYSAHLLEKSGLNIYHNERNAKNLESNQKEDEYKNRISEAYFRYIFDTKEKSDDVIRDNKKLEKLLSPGNGRRLFHKHLGHLFSSGNERQGYIGKLNFVYPIAATVEGPFDQPKEAVYDLKTAESIEARWWSNKWKDEFGGFPFLLLEYSGVAFHGPITNFGPLDIWFLRRGYVSHGCHRMDSSDVLELRTLMPLDLKKAAGKIKVIVLDHFDIADVNNDGSLEAIDVKYYQVPTSVSVPKNKTIDEVIKPWMINEQQGQFFKNNAYASKYYDSESDTLKNAVKYTIKKKSLVKEGKHPQVKIQRFDYRPSRVIQYTEDSYILRGFDDSFGKYPPKYFQQY